MADYTSDKDFRSRRPAMVMFACAVAAFGSFLWLKMRLVGNMPRTAYAEPEKSGAAGSDADTAVTNTESAGRPPAADAGDERGF